MCAEMLSSLKILTYRPIVVSITRELSLSLLNGIIEWYKSDTTFSIENLRKEIADVAITYHAVAERTALDDNVIDRVVYAWRDHWMLVGMLFILQVNI